MRSSLRRRLQVWYALVLLAVIVSFAGLLYARVRDARMQEVDNQVEAAVNYLDAHLRSFPRRELEPLQWEDLFDGLPLKPPGEEREHFPERPPFEGKVPPNSRGGARPKQGFGRPPPVLPEEREQMLEGLRVPRAVSNTTGRDDVIYFIVWRDDGTIVKSTWPEPLPSQPVDVLSLPAGPRLEIQGDRRLATIRGPQRSLVMAGRSVAPILSELRSFAWQLTGVGTVVLIVGLAGGWALSARVVRPIAAISATAASISATSLSERIDSSAVDRELVELAEVLNAMFDRLKNSFDQQVRFTADASHELRTPLTVLRTQADLALLKTRTAEEYQAALVTCQRAANRMAQLVEGLLMLARADAGWLDLQHQTVDLRQVVDECLDLLRPLAAEQKISISTELSDLSVQGDAGWLSQVVINLVNNAIQYNRPGGEIRVRLAGDANWAVLSVADTGEGIAPEHQPHIFERFYRADKARSRATGGTGLGLAICKSIVESHGGSITFTTEVGSGSTFQVMLPRAAL